MMNKLMTSARSSFSRRTNSSLPHPAMLRANLNITTLPRQANGAEAFRTRQAGQIEESPNCCAAVTRARLRWRRSPRVGGANHGVSRQATGGRSPQDPSLFHRTCSAGRNGGGLLWSPAKAPSKLLAGFLIRNSSGLLGDFSPDLVPEL